jgi:hypothetical protein
MSFAYRPCKARNRRPVALPGHRRGRPFDGLKDQLLYSALHGTAMRYAAERRSLDESIEELREIADGRNDILAEAAGITAGYWYASPATHVGHELIGAGMLILAGGGQEFPLDYDELERWTRVGFERGMRSRKGER